MNTPFQLFTEGPADSKFIRDCIEEFFAYKIAEADIVKLNGWTGYKNQFPRFQQNQDSDIANILILDADDNAGLKTDELTREFEQRRISFHLYLLPGTERVGDLETLLAEIAVDKKLMNCFLEYEKCVGQHPKKLNDARIYSYLDMLLHTNYKNVEGKDLRKEQYRNYRNPAHWKL